MENVTNKVSAATIVESERYDDLHFDDTDSAIIAGLILPMGAFGFLANTINIYVLCSSPGLRNLFNFFVLSLSVSDLISSTTSPLFVYIRTWGFVRWNWPKFLCKVFWSGDMGTSALTALHIAVFSGLRFTSLKWPHKFTKFSEKHAKITIAALWLIALIGAFLPFAVWVDANNFDKSSGVIAFKWIPSCSASVKWFRQMFRFSSYGYTFFFFIPGSLTIIFSGGSAVLLLYRRTKRIEGHQERAQNESEIIRQRKENQAILQLILIVGSFLIGYLPFCVFFLYLNTWDPWTLTSSDLRLEWWLNAIVQISLRFSECLNPIFYNLASSKIRAETLKVLRKICFCKKAML